MSATGTLTPEQQTELVQIDALLSANETVLKQIAQSTEEAAIKARLLAEWQARIQELLVRRGIVLGDTIRLTGGRLAADGNVECSLVVQLRTAARIGAVRVSVAFDATEFAFVSATAGGAIVPASFLTQPPNAAGDPAIVLVQDASAAAEWGPGEHELARIRFRALNGMAQPLFRIPLKDLSISRNNAADPSFGTMDAVVFPP